MSLTSCCMMAGDFGAPWPEMFALAAVRSETTFLLLKKTIQNLWEFCSQNNWSNKTISRTCHCFQSVGYCQYCDVVLWNVPLKQTTTIRRHQKVWSAEKYKVVIQFTHWSKESRSGIPPIRRISLDTSVSLASWTRHQTTFQRTVTLSLWSWLKLRNQMIQVGP